MTPNKEKALACLMVHKTKKEAAEAAGITDRTLREYMRDPEFCVAYKKAAAGVMDGATRQLQQSLSSSIERLQKIVEDDNANSAAHIQAARTLLEYGLRFTEFNDILRELETAEGGEDVL